MKGLKCEIQIINVTEVQRTKQNKLEELGFDLGIEVLLEDDQKEDLSGKKHYELKQ